MMPRQAKRNKNRKSTKYKSETTVSSTKSESSHKVEEEAMSDIQSEQFLLSEHLNEYINEFQHKIDNLQCTLSDKELVVLFTMNLHPRWKRLVEPMEPTCTTWHDAASFAKYHCTKMSAILQCQRIDNSAIFTTPEANGLLNSGYFMPGASPCNELYPDVDKIKHLLKSTETAANEEPSDTLLNMMNEVQEDMSPKENTDDSQSTEEQGPPLSPAHRRQNDSNKNTKQPVLQSTIKLSPVPKQETAAVMTTTEEDRNNYCYKIPKEIKRVNLSFLELTIKDTTVKALLAKFGWSHSVIALDCAHRLNLPVSPANQSIKTEGGYVSSIGTVDFPLVHPADNTIHVILLQVLPLIFGGKVEIILGADFFDFYRPILNIKARAIYFLGKEAPYIVNRIDEN